MKKFLMLTMLTSVASAVTLLLVMAYRVKPVNQWDLVEAAIVAGLAIWGMAPFLLGPALLRRMATDARQQAVVSVALLAVIGIGLFFYIDSLFLSFSPTASWIPMLFVPAFQWGVIALGLFVCHLMTSRSTVVDS